MPGLWNDQPRRKRATTFSGLWNDLNNSQASNMASDRQEHPQTRYAAPSVVNVADETSEPPTPDGTGLPSNFQIVGPGIYRSSFPQPAHTDKLAEYNLGTIITLLPEGKMDPAVSCWMVVNGIEHHHMPVLPNKDPNGPKTPYAFVETVLTKLLSSEHAVLIHCNKGKHRTGCMTACFRKVTGWSTASALAEYEKYSTPKDRALDKVFITEYEPSGEIKRLAYRNGFVGGSWAQPRSLLDMNMTVDASSLTVRGVSMGESDLTMGTAAWGSSPEGSNW